MANTRLLSSLNRKVTFLLRMQLMEALRQLKYRCEPERRKLKHSRKTCQQEKNNYSMIE